VAVAPSASYSLTIRVQVANRPGMLGRVALAIGEAAGDICAVANVQTNREAVLRDSTIPSVFNKSVAPAVAPEVARAAYQTGTARRRRSPERTGTP
jgi:hypothetical protein